MWFVLMLISLLIGFAIGFVFCIWAHVKLDEQATKDGVIKLCGKVYILKEID